MKLHNMPNKNKSELNNSCSEITNEDWIKKANFLAESLPYIQKFSGETFVIKYGGAAMTNKKLAESFAHDIVLLKQLGINIIIVHGGGKKIDEVLKKVGLESKFINGLRVTDADTLEIVEMVLCGSINKKIVQLINKAGGSAVGLCGKDGNLIDAKKICYTDKNKISNNIEKILDMGFVGDPHSVNTDILFFMEESDFIPVIAPVCGGDDGATYNVNADSVAGVIAVSLTAAKIIFLTDISGVNNEKGELLSELTTNEANELIEKGVATSGMIPKLRTCINTVRQGYCAAHILDGRVPHVLLLELFTEYGTGTMIEDKVFKNDKYKLDFLD